MVTDFCVAELFQIFHYFLNYHRMKMRIFAVNIFLSVLLHMTTLVRGFSQSSSLSTDLFTTAELNKANSTYKILLPIDDKGEGALWTLSKMVISNKDDDSMQNLTIYSTTVFWNFSDSNYSSEAPVCDAYLGEKKCKKCTICSSDSNSPSKPWTLSQGPVYFDCSGLLDDILCRSISDDSELVTDSACSEENSNSKGVESCFVDFQPPSSTAVGSIETYYTVVLAVIVSLAFISSM
jgi:hypothetical protein